MKPFKNILVGITYTDSSRHALKQAFQITKDSGATLRALHVVPPSDINEYVKFYMIDRTVMMNSALSHLEDFVTEALGDDHGVCCQVEEGIPHHELIALTDETKADLLIVAANDSAKRARNRGKFAIKCLRFSTIPVLLVDQNEDRPYSKVTSCIDFSESSDAVLQATGMITQGNDHDVEIVHAICPPWLNRGRIVYLPDLHIKEDEKKQFHEILDAQLNTIKQSATHFLTSKPTCLAIEHEDPDLALLNYFKKSQSDLAVIGRSGKGAKGLKSDLLGGTAETLIRHAHCSVLAVPIVK